MGIPTLLKIHTSSLMGVETVERVNAFVVLNLRSADVPTYKLRCNICGDFEQWQSIHDGPPALDSRGHPVVTVITRVATHGVGNPGARTREVDAMEARWDKDRPAYKRLRDEGHQPPAVNGAYRLEAHAKDEMYIRSGGKVAVPDDRKDEVNEMLNLGRESGWSPVEQVHTDRAAK